MKKAGLIYLFLVTMVMAWGQNERKVIRQGLRAYRDGEFSEAEVQFRKAGDINQESFEAEFNTGTALYGQEKYEETVKQYESLVKQSQAKVEDNPESLAHIWHNIGNSLLEAQQYGPSIEAYKNSLRLNPDDFDSKYNLAYAKQKMKEQENQDQGGENDQQKGQKDQQEQNQNQQPQDQEQQQQDQKDQPQDQEQQAKPQAREISKEDAERMLNAIQQQEKDVKDKVDEKKAASVKVKTKKDW
ncbi:MAG: tetratricopeptide repeat protein [Bacteroidia bacterium]|nr:MAG: tetratricopeptide repeat protein [Bacteroidia bacterium]